MGYKDGQRVSVERLHPASQESGEAWQGTISHSPLIDRNKPGPDWHFVKFDNGGALYVHESKILE